MIKKYDLCVKVGEYTDKQGKPKGRYENVGAVIEGDKGPYLILKRTFNPAGVPNPENRDTVIVSCFDSGTSMPDKVKAQVEGLQPAPQQTAPSQHEAGFDNFDDEQIPF